MKIELAFYSFISLLLVAQLPALADTKGVEPTIDVPSLRQGVSSEVRPGQGPVKGFESEAEEEVIEANPKGRGVSSSAPIEPIPPADPEEDKMIRRKAK